MPEHLPLSDHQLRIICLVITCISLPLNTFCLYLIIAARKIYAPDIFKVTILLQILYMIENVYFTVMFLPFYYGSYGGGYCIGFVCNTKLIPHYALSIIFIFMMSNLSGLFIVLLFFRHQHLMSSPSKLLLGNLASKVYVVAIVILINIFPVSVAIRNGPQTQEEREAALDHLCPSCGWTERGFNFVAMDKKSVTWNAIIVGCTVFFSLGFAIACAVHIMYTMQQHRKSCSQHGSKITVTIKQTRQTLLLLLIFMIFQSIPIAIYESPLRFKQGDWLLLPANILLSLNSFAHSFTLIHGTPPFRKHIRQLMRQSRIIVSVMGHPAFKNSNQSKDSGEVKKQPSHA